MRDERLLHLHGLEDDDEVTLGDGRAVRDGDLDDGPLHGGRQRRAARGGLRARAAANGPARCRPDAPHPQRERRGQHDLEPLAADLDDDPLEVGRVVRLLDRRRCPAERRERVGELRLDPAGVDREGRRGVGGRERLVLEHRAVERDDRRDADDVQLGQRPPGAGDRLRDGPRP